jgi:hypothetical protein
LQQVTQFDTIIVLFLFLADKKTKNHINAFFLLMKIRIEK